MYNRTIDDFILLTEIENTEGANTQFQNAGELNTKGIELALNYDVVKRSNINYNTGVVLSGYNTDLEEFIVDRDLRGNLGAPGQNESAPILIQVGEEIGQIFAPRFLSLIHISEPTRPY